MTPNDLLYRSFSAAKAPEVEIASSGKAPRFASAGSLR